MKNYFSMSFLEQEIILSKSNVSFDKDFGIVKIPCLVNSEYLGQLLFGVVDQDFNTIIPLFPYENLDRISFINSKNIIMKVHTDWDHLWHVVIKENKTVFRNLPFLDYSHFDHRFIKVRNAFFGSVYSFYDVFLQKLVLPYFHYISDFYYDLENHDLRALAIYFVPYDEHVDNQIITYINSNMEIITPYIDSLQNKEYDSKMEFSTVLSLVKEDMKGHGRV